MITVTKSEKTSKLLHFFDLITGDTFINADFKHPPLCVKVSSTEYVTISDPLYLGPIRMNGSVLVKKVNVEMVYTVLEG